MCCTYRGKRRNNMGWRRLLLMILVAGAIGVLVLVGTLYQRAQAPMQEANVRAVVLINP